MDYRKKYLNRTGFQRAGLATLPYLSRGWSQPGVYKAPRGFTGMQEILAGGILGTGASKFLEDKKRGIGDNNPPSPIEEEKPPKKEPPEDPDLLPEIATELINKELEDKAEHKFQYMANKEGGQTIGNREIILKLDKEIFNKYVKKLSNIKTFEKHEKEFPNTYVKFFKRGDLPEYKITKVGQLGEEIVPELIDDSIYNIKIKDFNSKKAIKHSKIFDSDIYPDYTDKHHEYWKNKKAHGGLINKPLPGGSRYI